MRIDKPNLLVRASLVSHIVLWATFGLAFWTPDSWMYIKLGLVAWLVTQISLAAWSWQGQRPATISIGVFDTLIAGTFGSIATYEMATKAEWELLWQFGHVARVVWIGLLFLSGATILVYSKHQRLSNGNSLGT